APPAIISVFLGDQLTDVFEQIKKGGAKKSKKAGMMTVGVDMLPPIPKHAGDRNRTSPFAFTGNRFEFRAVGSNQSIAGPLVAMNTIVAESLDYCATELEKATKGKSDKLNAAVQKLLSDIMKECDTIIFNGDGYSEEWHEEAEKRGLLNLKTSADALPYLKNKDVEKLLKKYDVLSPRELDSRYEVYTEQYIGTVAVEAKLTVEIASTMIFPAAVRYQNELASTCVNLQAIGYEFDTDTLDTVTALVKGLQDAITVLKEEMEHEGGKTPASHAKHACEKVLPAMLEVRKYADELEHYVADDLWPLPTYQEMLFIK
ncbi:MAG: glutamine synthetase type III, partial [Gemmatimonadota bacterium]